MDARLQIFTGKHGFNVLFTRIPKHNRRTMTSINLETKRAPTPETPNMTALFFSFHLYRPPLSPPPPSPASPALTKKRKDKKTGLPLYVMTVMLVESTVQLKGRTMVGGVWVVM